VPVNVTGSKQAGFISVHLSIESDKRFLTKETVFDACEAPASHRRFLIEKEKGIPLSNFLRGTEISIAGGKKQDIQDVHIATNTGTKGMSHLVFECVISARASQESKRKGSEKAVATYTPSTAMKSLGNFVLGDVVLMKVPVNEDTGYTDRVGFFVGYAQNPAYTRGDFESRSMMVIQVPQYDADEEINEATNYFVCVHSATPTLVLKASFLP
jgi:hypothetical protein